MFHASRTFRREEKLLLLAVVLSASAFAWTLLRSDSGTPAWVRQAVVVVAFGLILVVPSVRYLRGASHDHAPLRWTARLALLPGIALAIGFTVSSPPPTYLRGGVALYLAVTAVFYLVLRRQERDHYRTPVRRHQRLSVTVIARNEEDRLGRCLESVHGWADEIVVLDSGSTDDTVEVAKRYTDRVRVTDWPGYGPQKQRALEQAAGDWVLSIDADEEVTPELRHDIDSALGEKPACVAYKLPWGVIVYGKLLDFGQSARAPLRLFVREGSRFTDAQVHETVVPPAGKVGQLRGRLLHFTQRDFGHALRKVADYGWLGARKRFETGKRGGGAFGAALRSLWVFFHVYVIRLGFLDGQPGLVTAALYMQVSFDKYAGLWALRRERRGRPAAPSGGSEGSRGRPC